MRLKCALITLCSCISMPKTAAAKDPVAQFEHSMTELESIVQKMERGELSLEESLGHFERGMALSTQCRAALETAELKVKTLIDGEFRDTSKAL